MKSIVLSFILPFVLCKCPDGNIESIQCSDLECHNCVKPYSLLVGGRDTEHWRNDAEIWDDRGKLPIDVADFPYALDHPYSWWSRSEKTVLVCGGKNWDLDVSDNRCWTYDACSAEWNHVLDLPFGLHGGISGYGVVNGREEFWVVGGGNGTASNLVFIVTIENGDWKVDTWSETLREARFGQCGLSIGDEIVVIGGKNGGIIDSVEIINMATKTHTPVSGASQPHKRWGSLCLPFHDTVMMMGGMDAMFMPHSNVDMFDPRTLTWTSGVSLPWAQSGALGAIVNGGPTVFGGMGLIDFHTEVATFDNNKWTVWESQLETSRISGLALSIPSDIFDVC